MKRGAADGYALHSALRSREKVLGVRTFQYLRMTVNHGRIHSDLLGEYVNIGDVDDIVGRSLAGTQTKCRRTSIQFQFDVYSV